MPVSESRLPGFYKHSVSDRLRMVAESAQLSEEDVEALATGQLGTEVANRMIENVIGLYALPVGIATNFVIDGEMYLIPFVVEEASVVAAASNAAKRCQSMGGFRCSVDDPVMIGQVEIRDVACDPREAMRAVEDATEELGKLCEAQMGSMVARGGGFRGLRARNLGEGVVCVHFHLDCRDAMGANAVNTVVEAVAPRVAELCQGRVGLRILSNLADLRMARCRATFAREELGGDDVVDGIVEAYRFARLDPYRACTNNKGVMNACSAVALAAGQDWRAIEAGAHAYCCRDSSYAPLTKWTKTPDGHLEGFIEMPMAVGLVGGAVKVAPVARANVNILGVDSAAGLAKVIVAAGLAQNLAALRALATDGIQKGHMRLHARSRQDAA